MNFRAWLRVQFTSVQLNRAREDFIEARKLIDKGGWTNDRDDIEWGAPDLAQALVTAAGVRTLPTFDSPAVIAESIFARHVGTNIFTWNDTIARSKRHVIATLDGLIAILTEETHHGPADTDQKEKERGKSSAHVGAH